MNSKSAILFTVITPSLNCADFIRRNIDSVRAQGLPPDRLEHWIIDGGSTDGTVEILKSTPDIQWISEPDKGLSDAVNKGIQRAMGEWIAWINADDQLCPDALETVKKWSLTHPDIKLFAGDEIILNYDGTQEQVIQGRSYTFDELLGHESGINQASTLVHRSVYDRVGLLDTSIRYAMDYEWMVRATKDFACVHIPAVLTAYQRRPGSLMDAHMAAHFRTFQSVRRRFHRPLFEPLGRQILFYLATDRLRRTRWIRRAVRAIKGIFGVKPPHPF